MDVEADGVARAPSARVEETPSCRATAEGADDERAAFITRPVLTYSAVMPPKQSTVLDARAVDRTLRRMADEIVELNAGTDDLIIVGIQRRGVQLAARIVSNISERENAKVPLGALDITLYRDDLQTVGPRPVVGPTQHSRGRRRPSRRDRRRRAVHRPHRSRRARRAGRLRPAASASRWPCSIDRGGRELPIQPDIVGKRVECASGQRVDVLVEELDERDAVVLSDREEPA